MDAITIMNHFRLEFPAEDLPMIRPIVNRPRPTAPPRATGNVTTYLYDDVIGRLNAANVRTGN